MKIKTERPIVRRTRSDQVLFLLGVGLLVQICLVSAPNPALADKTYAGTLIHSYGSVARLLSSGGGSRAIKNGEILQQGDIIRTGPHGGAAILCADESMIRMNADTVLVFEQVARTASWVNDRGATQDAAVAGLSVYRIKTGEIWLRNKNEKMVIRLETAFLSVRLTGTELDLLVLPEESTVMTVQEGLVIASNRYGSISVAEREAVVALSGKPLEKQIVVSSVGSVQWTLSLPYLPGFLENPLISSDRNFLNAEVDRIKEQLSVNPSDTHLTVRLASLYCDLNLLTEGEILFKDILRQTISNEASAEALAGLAWIMIRRNQPEDALNLLLGTEQPTSLNLLLRSVAYSRMGELDRAKEILESGRFVDPDFAPFAIQLAKLHIYEKKFDDARRSLNQVLIRDPENVVSLSLMGLVDLIRGRKEAAIASAERAVAAGQHQTFPLLVLSYAHQAAFHLDTALSLTQTILELDKSHVIAQVHLAQLRFAGGHNREADRIIQKTVEAAPDSAVAQSCLGFIRLAANKNRDAEGAFLRAIRIDGAMGDPHLGLALLYMRQGNDQKAMEEISKAVLLEPQRAIYLSYWAKMLYQLKRFDKALDMLSKAAALDTEDPTPHYTRSLILNDLHQPTAAINALNQAIAQNDNRAVYRSRFLLDRDLSMKNIDLSYIYNQLGLSEWAVSKAASAAQYDFSNSSAHFFLGNALTKTEDRTLCALNELLLARILQPANQNTFNTFNDYTSFFEAPELHALAKGDVGRHDAYLASLSIYGSNPNLSAAYELYGAHRKKAGFRRDEDAYLGTLTSRLKWDATENDHLFLELNLSDNDYGYNALSGINEVDAAFYPDDYTEIDTRAYEIGYHHRFSPASDLILYTAAETQPVNRLSYIDNGGYYAGRPDITLFTRQYDQYERADYRFQGQQMLSAGNHQMTIGIFHMQGHERSALKTLIYLSHLDTRYPLATDFYDYRTENRLSSFYFKDLWRMMPWFAIDAALYHDCMTNTNVYFDTRWDIRETSPRLGLIVSLTDQDTLRIAGFRYLTPFLVKRIDPLDIAGIPIFRDTIAGTLADEVDFIWEHEWRSGYLRSGIYYLDRFQDYYNREVAYDEQDHLFIIGDPVQLRDTGYAKGLHATINQLLWQGWGGSLAYEVWETRDTIMHDLDHRVDHLGSLGLFYVSALGVSARVKETFRITDFKENSRSSEDIFITDIGLDYELPRKLGRISFSVDNLFDETFNWISNGTTVLGRSPTRVWSLSVECRI